jgi:glutamine amidotransferase-like uncharacterized protein
MMTALESEHTFQTFGEEDVSPAMLSEFDIVAFPGGIGDSDSYYEFFPRRRGNAIADFVDRGGHYLGICMGAYWAGSHYFDILDGLDAVQYIKRPGACVRRSFGTKATVTWPYEQPSTYDMYFYDGCAIIGDTSRCRVMSRYANGDAMAVIQGRIGIIGCHPESMCTWYDRPYMEPHWHRGDHHRVLRGFVQQLLAPVYSTSALTIPAVSTIM